MKILMSVFTLSLLSASAYSADLRKANLYDCKAREGSVSLATSSFRGEPQLYVSGESLSETELITTARGLEATAFVTNLSDASQTYTLIVPEVMIQNVQATQVNGILIQTKAGGLINPEFVPGPIQRNTVQTVKCEVQVVNF